MTNTFTTPAAASAADIDHHPEKDNRNMTTTLYERLRAAPANASAWFELAQTYAGAGLPWQARYCAGQAVRCDGAWRDAAADLQEAMAGDWPAADSLLGRPPAAEALHAPWRERLEAAAMREPGDWLTWLYLARLREQSSDAEDAARAQALACSCEPLHGETLHWLGVWRLAAGDAQGAVQAFSGLLDILPPRCGSMMFLGDALLRLGNVVAAEKAFVRAGRSGNPDFLGMLADKLFQFNYWEQALDLRRRVAAITPEDPAAWLALGRLQMEVWQTGEARQSLELALELDPGNEEAAFALTGLPARMGDADTHFDAMLARYREGDPLSRLASSVAMTSLYSDRLSAREVADLHREMVAPIEAAFTPHAAFANPLTTDRRLRLGIVSGDFHRQHPVNLFMLPVLQRFDPGRVEVFVYHCGTMHDEFTRQAQAAASRWLEVARWSDRELQQVILDDRIDVLLDLAGHTTTHRLGVFAMRAAPVQATFLGYPHSTGLSRMDWLIGDATVAPPEHAELFSERVARLPHSVFCWAPTAAWPLPISRPRISSGVVFGSFNNAIKLNRRTLELWARVLAAVPDSRLLLKAPSLRDAGVCDRYRRLLDELGVAPDRLILRGPTGLDEMMQEYASVDIALDPTPYNGGTTTLQALWMGVPVVTLAGENFAGRMGASFLRALGLPDWVASSADEYVAIAARLAADREALAKIHATLRDRMRASPLCDIDGYTRDMESLLLWLWQEHCRQHSGSQGDAAVPEKVRGDRKAKNRKGASRMVEGSAPARD